MNNDTMTWQPIETALMTGEPILVSGKGKVDQVQWEMDGEYWCATGGKRKCGNHLDYEPTHWMPLPPPPQDDTIKA